MHRILRRPQANQIQTVFLDIAALTLIAALALALASGVEATP
jgi:hypothetical protein